jgi:predicted AlkP superfamily pyrophosphatase or phosphodiesterase
MAHLTRRRFAGCIAGSLAAARLSAIPPRPKLVILLLAEQFRSDYLSRFSALFAPGGFRRLMEEGAYMPDCRMSAISFAASGLETIATGAYPQAHGIVAESWYDSASRKMVTAGAVGSQATTLADEIVSADARNRVFVVDADGSRASLLARRVPHRILALNGPIGAEAEWVETFRQSHSPQRFKNAKWQALQADPNAPPLRVLLDDPADDFMALYNASPFAQETQFDFLRAAITEEKLGQGPALDFVAVILGQMAQLGYEVGADSPLMREMVLHLDRQIELTLEALKKLPVGLVFAAAHGAPDHDGRRVNGASVAQVIDQALSDAYDVPSAKNRYVERYVYPFVYLNHNQLSRYDVDLRAARRLAGEAAVRLAPGVAAYYTADGDCSMSGDWLRRFQNSFHSVRSGDLMLAYEPNAVEEYGAGRGISYGSVYNYDVQTPLLFHGSQFRARTAEGPVEPVDIAPTLARALRVTTPSSSTGRVLGDVFAPDKKGEK